MRAVLRPWRTFQDGDDGLSAHAGDDHCIRFLRRDIGQPVTQAEADTLHAIFLRSPPRVRQRLCADVRGNGALDTLPLQQPHRQIPVVRADICQTAARRCHVRQQLEPRL